MTKWINRQKKKEDYFKDQLKKTGHNKTLFTDEGGWDEKTMHDLVGAFTPKRKNRVKDPGDRAAFEELLTYAPNPFDLDTYLYINWIRDHFPMGKAEARLNQEARKKNGLVTRLGRGVYQKNKPEKK